MFQRSGAGLRRAVIMAAAVTGFGMMAATGSAVAADKGHGSDKYVATTQNCTVIQDWSYYRKCGDTGSEHEARAEPRRAPESQPETPSDNEPVGATAARARN
jgi:hypothetical protein